MNVLCNCGGRTGCIQRFCDSIPLVQARTDDVLAVADCIEDVRQALPSEVEELTAQWKMLVRAKFRKAVAALNEPGAVLPGAAAPAAARAPAAAAPPPPRRRRWRRRRQRRRRRAPPTTMMMPTTTTTAPAAEAPESDSDDERPVVVEMRRVGDTAWRGFAMQKDAAKAFGVSQGDVSLLVNHPTKCPARLRQYEARRPVDSDGEGEGTAEDEAAEAPRRMGQNKSACEIRRVGDKKWRRFASRADADGVFPGLHSSYISRLISKNPSNLAPQHIRDKYEARNAVDESDSDSDSDSDSEEEAGSGAGGRDDAAAEAPAYKVGDRVKARYRGAWGAMYEGTIKAVKAGGDGLLYAVDFDDGDYDGSVKPCHIKALRAAAPRPAPAPAPAPAAADEDSDSGTEPSPTPERRPAKRRRSDAKPAVPALVVRDRRGQVANHGTLAGLIAAGLIAPGPSSSSGTGRCRTTTAPRARSSRTAGSSTRARPTTRRPPSRRRPASRRSTTPTTCSTCPTARPSSPSAAARTR